MQAECGHRQRHGPPPVSGQLRARGGADQVAGTGDHDAGGRAGRQGQRQARRRVPVRINHADLRAVLREVIRRGRAGPLSAGRCPAGRHRILGQEAQRAVLAHGEEGTHVPWIAAGGRQRQARVQRNTRGPCRAARAPASLVQHRQLAVAVGAVKMQLPFPVHPGLRARHLGVGYLTDHVGHMHVAVERPVGIGEQEQHGILVHVARQHLRHRLGRGQLHRIGLDAIGRALVDRQPGGRRWRLGGQRPVVIFVNHLQQRRVRVKRGAEFPAGCGPAAVIFLPDHLQAAVGGHAVADQLVR